MRLGIDFGTSRTVVSVVQEGNYPVCTFDRDGDPKEYVPSIVASVDGQLLYGWDAVERLHEPGIRVIRSMKRLTRSMGPDEVVDLGPGAQPTVLELVTGFLAHVRSLIVEHSNLAVPAGEPLEALVAAPANASSNQRYITLEAFRRAEFEVVGLMSEPSAGAVEFVHRYLPSLGARSPKKYVVVYDLGGGTFDSSVVGLQERAFEVLGTEGIAELGGDDFDAAIADLALLAAEVDGESLDTTQQARLLEECRERKEGLKTNTRKLIVDLAGAVDGADDESVVVTANDVYDRCEPMIEDTVAAVERVVGRLDAQGIDPEDSRALAALYLVGGSVAFPPIGRRLRQLYPRKVKVSPFPHAATAIGLAIASDPAAKVRVRESVSRHIGVWRELAGGAEKVFDPIFLKDARVPEDSSALTVVRSYHPSHNLGCLRYLECGTLGPDGQPDGDITPRQTLLFPYDPALRGRQDLTDVAIEQRHDLGHLAIRETYTYDAEGLVSVLVEDLTSGYSERFALGRIE